jgi:nitrite reductase/ring-hydroxylating ferredoxin subunit
MNELDKIKKEDPGFVEIGKASEISDGKMKHVEVDGKEVLIANVGGNFYAVSDRCGHSNASLSKGILTGNIVTCPLHGAQFNVTTGRKVKEFDLKGERSSLDKLPDDFRKYLEYAFELIESVKTHDQEKYELEVDGDRIKIMLPIDSNNE